MQADDVQLAPWPFEDGVALLAYGLALRDASLRDAPQDKARDIEELQQRTRSPQLSCYFNTSNLPFFTVSRIRARSSTP